jgi:hypothetical protein
MSSGRRCAGRHCCFARWRAELSLSPLSCLVFGGCNFLNLWCAVLFSRLLYRLICRSEGGKLWKVVMGLAVQHNIENSLIRDKRKGPFDQSIARSSYATGRPVRSDSTSFGKDHTVSGRRSCYDRRRTAPSRNRCLVRAPGRCQRST